LLFRSKGLLRAAVAAGLMSVVAISPAAAQTMTATTGAVNGLVTDSTKAVVPGVTISLSGPSLMTSWTTVTDERGAYRFSAVPAGDHTLTFELAGFGTVVREAVHVGVGFTATVSVDMSPGPVSDRVDVRAASSTIDRDATDVTTRFDRETLATLPGARDFFAVVANTPGIAMSKMDVGGNAGLSLQDYTAYGLRALTGMNRNEVEGIRVGAANGTNDNYLSDFGSFSEIAIKAAGNTAAMPVPGTLSQSVSKSGGNAYHGSLYTDFQDAALEAANIDGGQIARGVSGGPGLNVREVNRLERFRDFTADIGGYLKKSKAWWYGSYRSTAVSQRYAWLLDSPAALAADVGTGKVTYLLSPRQKLVGYIQRQGFNQSSFFTANASQPVATSDALPSIVFPVRVWKAEYNAAVTDALYVEARIGGYRSDALVRSRSTAPRISDPGANTVSGGAPSQERLTDRPQANGSVSFMKTGWAGSHTFRIGGEYMADHAILPHDGYGSACNCVSTLNNGAPAQVQMLLGPNVSRNELETMAGFVDDTWRLHRRITVSLGLRLDRYRPILPAQEGPAGQKFAAIDPVLTFNNWGPRAGVSADLTGDGKTLLKGHYGRFWLYPGPNFTAAVNPNPSGWSQTYLWTNDANTNGRWDPGEEGALTSVSGGSASTRLDPAIANSYVDQATAYVEREVAPDVAVRTGVVVNARRQPYGTVNVSRPLGAYSVPVAITDPGSDGRVGTADDGMVVTAYNLAPQYAGVPPVNLTTNLPGGNSEYYTWDVSASKRQSARWSLLGSVTKTWSHEAALGSGNDFSPNALVNSTDGQDRFTTWQAKLHGTARLPWDVLVVPVLRHQSGTPFSRTFVRTLNYGNATIKAEPIAANRTPNITLVDVRTEKTLRAGRARVMGFLDVYNIFNTNAAQTLTTSSGSEWLRPTVITGPRILRIGARVEW
jgi:Carboxypeptidase regulatory-like domain